MKTIKEVIVVEGKHDTAKLKQYFDCQTIETGGTRLSKETIQQITLAQKECGVIVFTDPDYPGTYLRNQIDQTVPGCMHAYLSKEDARTEKKVGIEHAEKEPLEKALENLVSFQPECETITMKDLYDLGLIGQTNSEALRRIVGKYFQIGYGNGKAFYQRLNARGLSKEKIKEFLNDESNRIHF